MKNILIVDDELDICYFLTKNLKNGNYQASFVNTLKEAYEVLQSKTHDILLLDNHLPDGVGMDFAKEIKKNHPKLKIVMITAHDTDSDRDKAARNGVDYFVSKPFMMSEVNKAIEIVKKMD